MSGAELKYRYEMMDVILIRWSVEIVAGNDGRRYRLSERWLTLGQFIISFLFASLVYFVTRSIQGEITILLILKTNKRVNNGTRKIQFHLRRRSFLTRIPNNKSRKNV